MASQEEPLESSSFKQCTLGDKNLHVPDSDKEKRSRDSKSPVTKKPKQEPLRIGQLRGDVQDFLRKEAAERNLPGPLYQQKLSESLGSNASASTATSTMNILTNPAESCTKERAGGSPDEPREDDLLRAIIDESGTAADNDADTDVKVLPEPKPSHNFEEKGNPKGQNYECEAESQATPDGVPEAEKKFNNEQVYTLIRDIHSKVDTMLCAVGEPGGPSITRVRSLLAELPEAVCDLGDLPNIQRDLSEKQRLGKHQMREILRRIGFFCVFLENKYMAKLAKECYSAQHKFPSVCTDEQSAKSNNMPTS